VRFRTILYIALTLLLVTACGNSPEPPVTAAPLAIETSTSAPVLTPTSGTPLAILVVPPDLDPDTSNLYQKTVYDLTQQAGYRFQVLNSLTPENLDPALKVVIAVSADPGLAQLAAAAPQAQFLAINIPDIVPGGNVSVLANSTQTDSAAFLAGYTAAMTTEDYRIGMMMPKDNADAIRALNAFAKGMTYYCGTCKPVLFYNWTYPQYIEIPSTEDVNNYDAYADILMSQYKVGNIFLYPDIHTQDLVTYIGTTGTNMIGTISPEQRPAGWMMTIQPDVVKAIQNAWPQLTSGQGGLTIQSPLGLADIDPNLLSEGKQRLVEQTLQELQAGRIAIQ
jgi:hypothetical protein